jgi:hypothetical protein
MGTIWAKGVILNGEYIFPPVMHMLGEEPPEINLVDTCKLTLDRLGVAILFSGSRITLFAKDEARLRKGRYAWTDHLVNFLIYKSRINYNWYGKYHGADVSSFSACAEAGPIIAFRLERMVWKGIKKAEGRFVCEDSEPCLLEVDRAEFETFDKLIDRTLAVAIAYYLIGCENPRYFFVEFYKCLEVVEREFGGQRKMGKALAPHGFTEKMSKELTKNANDERMPISFGRHATKSECHVFDIDLRSLLRPRSMQNALFLESTRLCRACIDAYASFLRARP